MLGPNPNFVMLERECTHEAAGCTLEAAVVARTRRLMLELGCTRKAAGCTHEAAVMLELGCTREAAGCTREAAGCTREAAGCTHEPSTHENEKVACAGACMRAASCYNPTQAG